MKECNCCEGFPEVKGGDVVKIEREYCGGFYLVTTIGGDKRLHSLETGNCWTSTGSLWGILSPDKVSVVNVCYKQED